MREIKDEHGIINYLVDNYFNEEQQAGFKYLQIEISEEDAFIDIIGQDFSGNYHCTLQEAIEYLVEYYDIDELEIEDYLEEE